MLILTNLIGFIYMITSNDWLITILSWELYNISIYLLIGTYGNKIESSLSATIKYFLLSAITTGFLLLSLALIYTKTGSTHYDNINVIMNYDKIDIILLPMLFTFLFKLGVTPLHNWVPDIYDNIPTPLTLWLATISKLGILFLFLQINFLFLDYTNLVNLIFVLSIFSMIIGSIGLMNQYKIKRFIAYSSISHMGYILIGLLLFKVSFIYYLIIYTLTVLGLFAILLSISIYEKREIN